MPRWGTEGTGPWDGLAEGAQVEMELLHVQVKPPSLSFSPLYPFSAGPFLLYLSDVRGGGSQVKCLKQAYARQCGLCGILQQLVDRCVKVGTRACLAQHSLQRLPVGWRCHHYLAKCSCPQG